MNWVLRCEGEIGFSFKKGEPGEGLRGSGIERELKEHNDELAVRRLMVFITTRERRDNLGYLGKNDREEAKNVNTQ